MLEGWTVIRWICAAAAGLFVGFAKTGLPGSGMPAIALMAEAFRSDVRLSVGAMLPVLLVGDLFAVFFYRRHTQWRRLRELFPFVAVGMIPGYLVLWLSSSQSLKLLLGALILTLLSVHVVSRLVGKDWLARRPGFGGVAGLLAGFGTAVGNAAGPIMTIYLLSRRLEKQEFMGTVAWFFFIVNLSKIPFFGGMGILTPQTLLAGMVAIPMVVVGALLGAGVLKRLPQTVFEVLVLIFAGLAGLRLLLS